MLRDRSRAGMVTVTTCTHTGALYGIATEWHQLWLRCAASSPFQCPAWLLPWWRHFGRGGLWTMCFRDPSGCLVGIAPLYVHIQDGLRTIRLVGAGLSDYLDILVEDEWRDNVVQAIVAELKAHSERWDVAEFQQLPADSPLLQTDGSHSDETVPAEPCPVLEFAGAQDVAGSGVRDEAVDCKLHEASPLISDRLLANVAQDRRRLGRRFGNIAIEAATLETAGPIFAELRRLHTARWQARGQFGVLADETVWRFQEEAGNALTEHRVVRLFACRAAGKIAGVYYGFHAHHRAYYYLGGFDPAFCAYGIGNQLVAHAISVARREGARSFDFLRGQESYKYRWGARDAATFNRRLYREPVLQHAAPEVFQPRVESSDSAVQSVA